MTKIRGRYLSVHGFEIEVTHDADDLTLDAGVSEILTDHVAGIFDAQCPGCCCIEQEIGRIGGKTAGIIPAGHDVDAIGLGEEIVIDGDVLDVCVYGRRESPLSVEAPCSSRRRPLGTREERVAWRTRGTLKRAERKELYVFVQSVVIAQGDDMFFVEAQGGAFHIMQLLKDDGGADEQYDGDGELVVTSTLRKEAVLVPALKSPLSTFTGWKEDRKRAG